MLNSNELERLERTLRREQAAYRLRQQRLLIRLLAAPIQLKVKQVRQGRTA